MCTHASVMHAYAGLEHAYAYACLRIHALGFPLPLFSKSSFIYLIRVIFSLKTFLKSISIWLGPKLTLGFRILPSLGNGGLSREGYKMRCLQMPLFWFMSSANEIKRIRYKIFCFNVQFKPNPHTWHTTLIHRAGCNFAELRGFRMSKFPPLLLEKWTMTGSLSQSLCQLQAKDEWLTILESLKRKTNMANGCNHQSNKQGALTSLKGYISVVPI